MIKRLTKFALSAAFGLALTFTFSCSSDDKDDGGTSSPSGNGDISSSSVAGGSNNSSSSVTGGGGVSSSSVEGAGGGIGSCPDVVTGDSTMACGGQTYRIVVIGSQTWMAENLNYAVKDSVIDYCNNYTQSCTYKVIDKTKCGNDKPYNCDKYGRLYDWATALSVCPAGWHLPSDADWNVLMKFVNPNCSDNSDCDKAGTKLKATSGWDTYRDTAHRGVPSGTDDFGFSAMPGEEEEVGYPTKYYARFCNLWSATSRDREYAYTRRISFEDESVIYSSYPKTPYNSIRGGTVRCVKD